MGKIVILDENTANQIAAGEVIERPASIVKEMAENALDAGATSITVEITGGGIESIRITDNGDGIEADDVAMSFERHATSKIRRIGDLEKLSTMGFRGEALASIASVAKVEVITRTAEAQTATRVIMESGNLLLSEPAGAPKGTTFIVRELFYNTPARYKFLKKDSTEAGYIQDILIRIALARPDISIKLISNGKTVMHTPGNHDLLSTIYALYGKETARSVIPVSSTGDGISITGYIGKPEIAKGNRSNQSIIVNGRFIYNRIITAALEEAYKTRLMQKRFPFAVLKLGISPNFVDVNVHPAKLEIRFSDEQKVFRAVYHSVLTALTGSSLIPEVNDDTKKTSVKLAQQSEIEQMKFQNKPPFNSKHKSITPNAIKSEVNLYNINKSEQNAALAFAKHIEAKSMESNGPQETGISSASSGDVQLPMESDNGLHNTSSETGHDPTGTPGTARLPGSVDILGIAEMVETTGTQGAAETYEPNGTQGSTGMQGTVGMPGSTATQGDDRERLKKASIIGQAFSSYIILEEGQELFLIDQHAAHERIRYEKIKAQYSTGEPFSQGLLSPLTVNLSSLEMDKFHEVSDFFNKLGFDVEDFGERTLIIRAIPYIFGNWFSDKDFVDILYKLRQEVGCALEIIPEDTIYMMACKSALKANREMTPMEIQGLIDELILTENPYTCVHGRPVIISMSKKELDRKFKRV